MSYEYEAWCLEKPNVASIARVVKLMMRTIIPSDLEVVVEYDSGRLWNFRWGNEASAVVIVMTPEFADIPGDNWILSAEGGARGMELCELLSLVIVAAAAVVHGGVVIDESKRLPERKNDPFGVLLDLARSGATSGKELLQVVRNGSSCDDSSADHK
ncbi:hypothetical protein GCM10027598_51480 [Amycolatopsis oliviviridis]|uniref:Uncharacterized protein n=1 Tax=Amycolatopsis oliviviridis TaxID=1471590 RepID=A0ABQ3MC51_9PSEU|nr:hypothetical protein [Amycolatopsis oliviviridis]GHH31808.1 hypothetical protein GCM10017790_67970 [Amycolatopsis oliviviridis]